VSKNIHRGTAGEYPYIRDWMEVLNGLIKIWPPLFAEKEPAVPVSVVHTTMRPNKIFQNLR
jgi:hypothetical protein